MSRLERGTPQLTQKLVWLRLASAFVFYFHVHRVVSIAHLASLPSHPTTAYFISSRHPPATSVHMFFSKHHRNVLRQENSDLSFGDLGKTVGAMWKATTPEERKPFEEMVANDKALRVSRVEYKSLLPAEEEEEEEEEEEQEQEDEVEEDEDETARQERQRRRRRRKRRRSRRRSRRRASWP